MSDARHAGSGFPPLDDPDVFVAEVTMFNAVAGSPVAKSAADSLRASGKMLRRQRRQQEPEQLSPASREIANQVSGTLTV